MPGHRTPNGPPMNLTMRATKHADKGLAAMTEHNPSSMNRQPISFLALVVILCMTVSSLSPALDEVAEETDKTIGPPLQVVIRCEEPQLYVGDEIPITFVITNAGAIPYRYSDGGHGRDGRTLSAIDGDGNRVPDPRAKRQQAPHWGLYASRSLRPGDSSSRTVALNRWALVTKPGTYRVVGTYRSDRPQVVSDPISIKVQQRSDAALAAYIEKLATRLSGSNDGQERGGLVRKLMYTCDRRIVPALIEAMYKSDAARYWAGEAFLYHLPNERAINEALLNAAANRGLAIGMMWTLKHRGFTAEHLKPLIGISLSADRPHAWVEGALAAQEFSDDRYTSRLVAIATDPHSEARAQAIHALALNRTDTSVTALKALLKEPDPPHPKGRTIRQTAEDAIRSAYLARGNTQGRRLRADDFDSTFQEPK